MGNLEPLTDEEIELVSGGIKLDSHSPGDDISDIGTSTTAAGWLFAAYRVHVAQSRR